MLHSINTEEQYENSLDRIFELMQKDIDLNSNDSFELEKLSILVENYEAEKYPMDVKLLKLIQESNRKDTISREKIMKELDQCKKSNSN